MTDLYFAKPCTFTDAMGETRTFAPGLHTNQPDEIAQHWFIQAHLAQDNAAPMIPPSAPLQHEERVQMKVALDAAEGRAAGFEAERNAASARIEALEAENATLKSRLAELETVDQATSDDAHGGTDDDFAGRTYGIKRRFGGKFAVVKQDDETVVVDSLSKADAVAKARDLNATA